MDSGGFHGGQKKGGVGGTRASAAPTLLARSLPSLGLHYPTEKGKKRVLQYLITTGAE